MKLGRTNRNFSNRLHKQQILTYLQAEFQKIQRTKNEDNQIRFLTRIKSQSYDEQQIGCEFNKIQNMQYTYTNSNTKRKNTRKISVPRDLSNREC